MPEDTQLLALIDRWRTKKPKRAKTDGGLVPRLLARAALMPLVRLFRNNNGALQDKRGRWVVYGLKRGSGDLIGYKSLIITPDLVGQRIAQFVSVEAKKPTGKMQDNQALWLEQCKAAGAIAVCVRSVEEMERALR